MRKCEAPFGFISSDTNVKPKIKKTVNSLLKIVRRLSVRLNRETTETTVSAVSVAGE
jgi:hypothetical protein